MPEIIATPNPEPTAGDLDSRLQISHYALPVAVASLIFAAVLLYSPDQVLAELARQSLHGRLVWLVMALAVAMQIGTYLVANGVRLSPFQKLEAALFPLMSAGIVYWFPLLSPNSHMETAHLSRQMQIELCAAAYCAVIIANLAVPLFVILVDVLSARVHHILSNSEDITRKAGS